MRESVRTKVEPVLFQGPMGPVSQLQARLTGSRMPGGGAPGGGPAGMGGMPPGAVLQQQQGGQQQQHRMLPDGTMVRPGGPVGLVRI